MFGINVLFGDVDVMADKMKLFMLSKKIYIYILIILPLQTAENSLEILVGEFDIDLRVSNYASPHA